MANSRKRTDGYKIKKEVVAEEEQPLYNKDKSTTKLLQSRISARVVVKGPVTGKRYIWERSGAIAGVDEKDVPGLLEKRLGDKTCCGGDPDNLKLFILVE